MMHILRFDLGATVAKHIKITASKITIRAQIGPFQREIVDRAVLSPERYGSESFPF